MLFVFFRVLQFLKLTHVRLVLAVVLKYGKFAEEPVDEDSLSKASVGRG